MWHVWYFDSVFSKRYVRVPGMKPFPYAYAAQRAAAIERLYRDLSFIVLPY